MSKTKYDKYFLKEPWGVPKADDPGAPVYIGMGQKEAVEGLGSTPYPGAAPHL